jgi:hypothetical protein
MDPKHFPLQIGGFLGDHHGGHDGDRGLPLAARRWGLPM